MVVLQYGHLHLDPKFIIKIVWIQSKTEEKKSNLNISNNTRQINNKYKCEVCSLGYFETVVYIFSIINILHFTTSVKVNANNDKVFSIVIFYKSIDVLFGQGNSFIRVWTIVVIHIGGEEEKI